jgi:hypothetical protein
MIAQGAALGSWTVEIGGAPTGHDKNCIQFALFDVDCLALSGLVPRCWAPYTQGVALGCLVRPLQGRLLRPPGRNPTTPMSTAIVFTEDLEN